MIDIYMTWNVYLLNITLFSYVIHGVLKDISRASLSAGRSKNAPVRSMRVKESWGIRPISQGISLGVGRVFILRREPRKPLIIKIKIFQQVLKLNLLLNFKKLKDLKI